MSSQTDAIPTELVWQDGGPGCIDKVWQLSGPDVKAENTWENPFAMVPQAIKPPALDQGKATLQLPPLSFTVVTTSARA